MQSKGLTQAYEVQDFMHACLMAMRDNLVKDKQVTQDTEDYKQHGSLRVNAPDKETCASLAALGKVWRDAQEQIRIHQGKPLPGSLTHEKVKRGPRQRRELSSILASVDAAEPMPEPAQAQTAAASDEQPNESAT